MWKMVSLVNLRHFGHLISKTAQARTVTSAVEATLFSIAATGDVSALDRFLQGSLVRDVNARDKRGWTALMFAARHGHCPAVNHLLRNNADLSLVNKTGQSAFDLAVFWQHREAAALLKREEKLKKTSAGAANEALISEILIRHSSRRTDKPWLNKLMEKPNTVFIATHKGDPLVVPVGQKNFKLSRLSYSEVKPFIDEYRTVFLGTHENDQHGLTAYFCVDLSMFSDEELEKAFPGVEVAHIFRLMMLERMDWRLITQARSLLDWHRYEFCPTCGSKTIMNSAGYKRICLNMKCATHERIHNVSYPRVDPTVICTVISSDGERCLLAHKPNHPVGMYSCIAGFVEPGETMEEACVREVEEEVGLEVKELRYHSSQYWPMPSCLMVGFMTKVTDKDDIRLDKEELEDGRWFSREEVADMLTLQHSQRIFVPPTDAIAHHLIKAWVMESAFKEPLPQ